MVSGYQNDAGLVQQEAGFGFFGTFWMESSVDGLVASATQTQAGATPLTMMLNRVATAAAVGNAVRLPPALQGLEVCVINDGANAITVFGFGTDTINGVAAATGIQQMSGSCAYYICVTAGKWSAPSVGVGTAGNFPTYSTQPGITASATQTQAAGTPITASQVQISVCAVAGNACTMPPAKAGMEITVINNGANAANIFPASVGQGGVSGGDTIAPGGQNVAFSLNNTTVTIFYCFTTGTWITK